MAHGDMNMMELIKSKTPWTDEEWREVKLAAAQATDDELLQLWFLLQESWLHNTNNLPKFHKEFKLVLLRASQSYRHQLA